MIEMFPCPACTELVTEGTCVCPHCGEKACRRSGVHGAAVLLGLTLVMGCGDTPNPDYTGAVTTGVTSTGTSSSWAEASGASASEDAEKEVLAPAIFRGETAPVAETPDEKGVDDDS